MGEMLETDTKDRANGGSFSSQRFCSKWPTFRMANIHILTTMHYYTL